MKNLFLFFAFILGMVANSFAQSNAIVIGDSDWTPHSIFRFQVFDEFNNAPLRNFSVEMKRGNYVGAKAVTDDLGVFVLIVYDPTLIRDEWILKIYDPSFQYSSYEQSIAQSDVYVGRNRNNVLMLYVENSRPVWWSSTSRPDKEKIAYLVSLGKYKIHNVQGSNVNYDGPEFFEKTIVLRYSRHPRDQSHVIYSGESPRVSNPNTGVDPLLLYPEEKIDEHERRYRRQQMDIYGASSYRNARAMKEAEMIRIDNDRQRNAQVEREKLRREVQEKPKETIVVSNRDPSRYSQASINLENREVLNCPLPISPPTFSKEERIVVSIIIDRAGQVIKAEIQSRETTISNPQILNSARNSALRTRFSPGELASQSGTITYVFNPE